ncbi:MAG: ABC transporter substrate-binding protein, partial [Ilumatobacteraceae bacterium]
MAYDPANGGLVPGRFNRRQLILGSGTAVAVAAALAACGSDSKGSTSPAATDAVTATDGATTATDGATTATDGATTPTDAAPAKAGGILRVGTLGGANDIIDAQHIVAKADIMRQVSGWEPLMSFSPDFVPEYTNGLASDVTAKAADNFVITMKDGLKFSNGNPLTADDVVYSLNRLLDPDLALYGGSVLRTVLDKTGITKVDDKT